METILFVALIFLLIILLGLPLYAIPATLSLPRGRRKGLEPLTIPKAVQQILVSGKSGLELVHAARDLVAQRMVYCRRNSFDIYTKAFERGYGYCQQQAYALAAMLTQLGFEAKVVHAFRNKFPEGNVAPHTWVRVIVHQQVHDVDSIFFDSESGEIPFTPLSKVLNYSPAFRILAGWGCAAVNAHRFYRTGKDQDW
ncbi:MAG: hypothetical protein GTO18_16145 [Anaerolineales bacterium]|nr:hypothetical protein [Anaerolineales bacterium]